MESDPLKELTAFYESKGYDGKEAVEKAEAELERRHQRELQLRQTTGKNITYHSMVLFAFRIIHHHSNSVHFLSSNRLKSM